MTWPPWLGLWNNNSRAIWIYLWTYLVHFRVKDMGGGRGRIVYRIDGAEIEEYRLAEVAQAAGLLSGPVRRRVLAAVGRKRCVYLEDGRRVKGVRS